MSLLRRRQLDEPSFEQANDRTDDHDDDAAGADADMDVDERALEVGLQSRWTAGSSLATRGASGLLWTALLAGPVALLLAVNTVYSSPPTAARVPAPAVDRVGEQTTAAAFAGRLVALWLTSTRGQEGALSPLVRTDVVLPQRPWTIGPPTVADQRRLSDGMWMVVTAVPVAPDLAPASATPTPGQSSEPWPVRYFQVPVHLDAAGPVALALPAPVAAPGVASDPPRLAYRHQVGPDEAIGQSIGQFLTALLTGAGDITRYLSPGTLIRPVTPPPYTTVRIDTLALDRELTAGAATPADGSTRRALATATVLAGPQQQTSVQYPLSLTVRGGRWEITALDPTPALLPPPAAAAGREPRPASTTGPAPAASSPPAGSVLTPPAVPSAPPAPPAAPSSPDALLD